MGREVAIVERQQPPVPAFGFNEVEKIATAIARGGLFGSKDPYAVLTLCMLAQAEGQHPAVVFRDYDIIQGKPAKKAEAMMRDFLSSGGKVTWNRLDDECCEAVFSHPQGGEATINWTLARAQKAQLGGKDNWKKWPRQMLRSRVVSEGVRTVCPTATGGLYVPDEVRDFGSDTVPGDTPATPEPKRARDLKAEIEATTDAKRAKAEDWLSWLKAEVNDAGGEVEAVRAIFEKAAPTLTKMQSEYPDLYEGALALKPSDDEQPPETISLADEIGLDDQPHPGKAKADAIIAELDAPDCNAILDVAAVLNRHANDMQSMLDEDAVRVEVAADKRRQAIRVEQGAGAK